MPSRINLPPSCRVAFLRMRALLPALLLTLAGCAVETPQNAAPASIALLVSDDSAAFRRVAQEIEGRAGAPVASFRLDAHSHSRAEILHRLQSMSPATTVVAIGLPAARLAQALGGRRVVFCQVSSHEEAALVSPFMKGVSAMPPPREQFRAWTAIAPRLKRIGMIAGPQLQALRAEAQQAARDSGLELVSVEVRSDREALYAFNRLLPRIEGLWLIPDNRILSLAVLREVMTRAVKEGKQVLAFSHELLALGALLSIEGDPADIARQVLARASAPAADGALAGAAVVPLTRGEVRVNAVMLRRFGLSLPAGFEGKMYAS